MTISEDESIRVNKIIINLEQELAKYELDGKWNDYIAVQKEILNILRKQDFFSNNIVCNCETGMEISISPKDIRETFGNGNKFQRLPKQIKIYKVATIGYIKRILETAIILEDDVENIHYGRTDLFAYFRKYVIIDGRNLLVRLSIKKKVGSNHFHIHHIDINEKNLELLGPSRKTDILETQDSIHNVSQETGVVKKEDINMTISEKIFEILDTKGISQKDFSFTTGIPQSTISDWRKKNTNPSSDKILAICDALDVTPYELLSNVKEEGNRANKMGYRIVVEGTEEDQLIDLYDSLDTKAKGRLLGYMEALKVQ